MTCLFFSVSKGEIIFMSRQTKEFLNNVNREDEKIVKNKNNSGDNLNITDAAYNYTILINGDKDDTSDCNSESFNSKFFNSAILTNANHENNNDDINNINYLIFEKYEKLSKAIKKLEKHILNNTDENTYLSNNFYRIGLIEYDLNKNENSKSTENLLENSLTNNEKMSFNFYYRKMSLNNEKWLDILLEPKTSTQYFNVNEKLNLSNDPTKSKCDSITNSITNSHFSFKNKFLSKIAHEFKTPLLCLISLSKEINKTLRNKTNEILKDKIDQMEDLSNYSLFLINDIVHFLSKLNKNDGTTTINYNKDNLNYSNVKIKEILNFAFRVLKTLLSSNKNKIEHVKPILEIDEEVENLYFKTDEHRLKQILLNLISNAVKFTKGGSIKIVAKFENDENKLFLYKKLLKIYVIDSGVGIKKSDQAKLFKDYSKIDSDGKLNLLGTGLGLSISQEMALSMGYSIELQSEYGKGSTFSIEIDSNGVLMGQNIIERSQFIKTSTVKVSQFNRKLSCPLKLNLTQKTTKSEICKNIQTKIDSENTCKIFKSSHFSKNNQKLVEYGNLKYNDSTFLKNTNNSENGLNLFQIDRSNPKIISNNTINNKFESELICLDTGEIDSFDFSERDSSFESTSTIQKDFEIDEDLIDFIHDFNQNPNFNKHPKSKTNSCSFSDLNVVRHVSKNEEKSSLTKIRKKLSRTIPKKKKISCMNINKNVNIFIQVQSLESCNFNDLEISVDSSSVGIKKNKNEIKSKFHTEKHTQQINNKIIEQNKKSILIIDDNVLMLRSLENLIFKVLKKFNLSEQFNLIRGYDGVDLLKLITDDQKTNSIICTFIDENLDFLNGSEAIKIIRKLENDQRIKSSYICRISADIEVMKSDPSLAENFSLPKPITEKYVQKILIESGVIVI